MRELAGDYSRNPDITNFMLCQALHCLPSQLEKEDGKTIEVFAIILNEFEGRKQEKLKDMENEARLKGMI